LRAPDLAEFVVRQLDGAPFGASKLCFELTETAAVQNLEQARWLMDSLRSVGCRFALDDFGAGVASYRYLRELPVDFVKIDRSFISGLESSRLKTAIVASIQHVGRVLGVRLVAEGIESVVGLRALQGMGVEFGQGYLLGRPAPLAHFLQAGESVSLPHLDPGADADGVRDIPSDQDCVLSGAAVWS
jgi:EAL domain-containing protein (putative c-di-GMP-specific phosphodiesterase class I)